MPEKFLLKPLKHSPIRAPQKKGKRKVFVVLPRINPPTVRWLKENEARLPLSHGDRAKETKGSTLIYAQDYNKRFPRRNP